MNRYTRKQAIEMHNIFEVLSKVPFKPKTAVRIIRNLTTLKEAVQIMRFAAEQVNRIKDYAEYNAKRTEICTTLAAKKEDGSVIIMDNRYAFPTQEIANQAEREVLVLSEQYKDAVNIQREYEEQVEFLLNEEVEYELLFINIGDTETFFTPQQLLPIVDLIED